MKVLPIASTLALFAITASRTNAQINQWEGDVSGNWNTGGNWSNNAVPNASGTDVVFNSAGLNQASLNLSANTLIRSMFLFGGNYTLSPVVAQTLSIQGGGFNQFGTGTFVVNTNILGVASNDIAFNGTGSGAITLNGTINNLAQRFDKWNESDVTLTNAYTTTNATSTALRVRAGSLILSGNGTISQGTGAQWVIGAPATYAIGNYINNTNAALILDNTGTNNFDRVTDGNQINLSTRSLIEFRGNSSAGSSETLGTLNAGGPGNRIRIDNGSGQSANVTFASLLVNGGANDGNTNTNPTLMTYLVNSGDTLGMTGATGGRVIFSAAPTLTNGVMKYSVIKTATDVNFATYDATVDNGAALGVKELGSYNTTDINAVVLTTNADVTGSATLSANRTANALRITSTAGSQGLDGNFNLTLQNAGGLILRGPNNYSIGGTGTVNFGSSSAAYAYIDTHTLTISKAVNFGGDFSKAGDGMLVIDGTVQLTTRQVGVDDGASVDDMQISGVLQNAGSALQKSGMGVLALTGAGDNSAFTKGVTLNAGTLVLDKPSITLQNNALGSGTFAWQGGTVAARGNAAILANTVNLGQQGSAASANQMTGDQAITFSGLVQGSLNSGQSYTLVNNATGLLTLSGTIQGFNANNASPVTSNLVFSGSGNATVSGVLRNTDPTFANAATMVTGVIKDGAGLLLLSAPNTYTGNTTVNAGYLRLDHSAALGAGYLEIAETNYASGLNAVVELGTGNSSFTRALGTALGQVRLGGNSGNSFNNAGFASVSGTSTVNLGGAGATVTWGSGSFFQAGGALILGSPHVAGTVEFQNGINLAGNRTIRALDGSAAVDGIVSGVIADGSGNRRLTKDGTGTLALTNANSYSGGTTVAAGTLLANNNSGSATGSGAITVNTTATLGGTGAVSGAVTLLGTLAPGAGIESMTTGAMTFGSSGIFRAELDTLGTTDADLLSVDGTLTIDPSATLNLTELFAGTVAANTKFTLISYLGAWNGIAFDGFADDSTFSLGSNQWTINYNDLAGGSNQGGGSFGNYVTLSVIPEPSVALLGGLGLLALMRRRRILT